MGPTYRSCPLCGEERHSPIDQYADHHLVRCIHCRMVFAAKLPAKAELDEMYADYPLHQDLSPITRLRYQELLQRFEAFRTSGSLLDAGSGSGFFLDTARELGWKVHGSEYDPYIVDQCRGRGITMWLGPLDRHSFKDDAFDVITSFEVLEHLVDPIEELLNFRRMLRPGGALYITTPNFNSVSRWLAGPRWNVVNYPEHLNYFTPHTMARALSFTGFGNFQIRTTGVSPSRLIVSRGHLSTEEANVNPQNLDQRLRGRIEANFVLKAMKTTVNTILDISKRGDSLKVFCS